MSRKYYNTFGAASVISYAELRDTLQLWADKFFTASETVRKPNSLAASAVHMQQHPVRVDVLLAQDADVNSIPWLHIDGINTDGTAHLEEFVSTALGYQARVMYGTMTVAASKVAILGAIHGRYGKPTGVVNPMLADIYSTGGQIVILYRDTESEK